MHNVDRQLHLTDNLQVFAELTIIIFQEAVVNSVKKNT